MIKPNSYPIKGNYNRIGYGYRVKNRSKYHKVEKRKAYRNIRRLGFDVTETWDLDMTIAFWFSDNIGGFFRECGSPDVWDSEDLDGNPIDYNNEKSIQKCIKAEKFRREEFLKNLENALNQSEILEKFIPFVLPRLKFLAKHKMGCPVNISFEEWNFIIRDMIECFENQTYSNYFTEYFFALWD